MNYLVSDLLKIHISTFVDLDGGGIRRFMLFKNDKIIGLILQLLK